MTKSSKPESNPSFLKIKRYFFSPEPSITLNDIAQLVEVGIITPTEAKEIIFEPKQKGENSEKTQT